MTKREDPKCGVDTIPFREPINIRLSLVLFCKSSLPYFEKTREKNTQVYIISECRRKKKSLDVLIRKRNGAIFQIRLLSDTVQSH